LNYELRFSRINLIQVKPAQQSVHLTLGILCVFLGFFYASTESCSQTESTPTPAQVTHAVGKNLTSIYETIIINKQHLITVAIISVVSSGF
jgi:hypothetical protein